MKIKAIDICLPPTNDRLEDWNRWLNRMHTQLLQAPWTKKIKIEVKGE